jgi:hypothetical protein
MKEEKKTHSGSFTFIEIFFAASENRTQNETQVLHHLVSLSPIIPDPPGLCTLLASTTYSWLWLRVGWSKPFFLFPPILYSLYCLQQLLCYIV